MSSDFNFTITSWFLENVRVQPYFKKQRPKNPHTPNPLPTALWLHFVFWRVFLLLFHLLQEFRHQNLEAGRCYRLWHFPKSWYRPWNLRCWEPQCLRGPFIYYVSKRTVWVGSKIKAVFADGQYCIIAYIKVLYVSYQTYRIFMYCNTSKKYGTFNRKHRVVTKKLLTVLV